ncbi:MAG: HPr family phosphocarrier protein [Anaerolineae bacterium]|nr:HPr family phosphocarrier protein [Anaerolineae bacterium]
MKADTTLTVRHEVGLHARPAALFVQTAAKYSADIQVRNLSSEGDPVNAKSILSILTLAVHKDSQIHLAAEGEDAAEAVAALESLVNSNFGED